MDAQSQGAKVPGVAPASYLDRLLEQRQQESGAAIKFNNLIYRLFFLS